MVRDVRWPGKIRKLVDKMQVTQAELSKIMGISQQTVSSWAIGYRVPVVGDAPVAENSC